MAEQQAEKGQAKKKPIKKGSLVRVVREKLENSLEAQASDNRFPSYLFDSDGEVLETQGEYGLVKFYVPTPACWLRLDQLEKTGGK